MITSSILDKKIPYRKQAELYVELSATENNPSIEVEVILDNTVLLAHPLTTAVTHVTHKFDDEPGEHELKIVLKGNPTGAMLCIRDLRIEGLNMQSTMSDSGTCIMNNVPHIPSEYMGQVGYQSLKFTTPIYPWLFNNEQNDHYYL